MDKHLYLKILKGKLEQSATLGLLWKNFLFQQDNDPKHISYLIKEGLLYNNKQLCLPNLRTKTP